MPPRVKYYAVVNGKNPGIYTTWKEAKEQVLGFPGAIFKSFHSRVEAEKYLEKDPLNNEKVNPQVLPLANKRIVYTDGSYKNEEGGCGGYGIVILDTNGQMHRIYGRIKTKKHTNNVAELYAIYMAIKLTKNTNILIHTDSEYAMLSLTEYIHSWIQNDWKGVKNRTIIEAIYQEMQDPNRTIEFKHVRGHCGIELNEEADRLANLGRLSNNYLIIDDVVRDDVFQTN